MNLLCPTIIYYMQENLIVLQQLTMRIASKVILDQLDLTVTAGDSVAIVGSNGSGKTTLVKILGGLLRPTQGIVQIAGLGYSDPKQALQLKHLLGFAPDVPPLYPNDTVATYLHFIASLKHIAKHQIQTRINNCLEIFELTAVRDTRIFTLSKGTQQRINLAQAVLHNPRILLLDEPTNGLDPEQCDHFCTFLKKLQAEKVTLLIASHQYTDVIPICGYMLKIQGGSIQKIMTPLSKPNVLLKETDDNLHYST
jgi:ABC-2 type transport system ATP-binding protein